MLQGIQTLGVRQAEPVGVGEDAAGGEAPRSYLPRTGKALLILHISKVQHILESYPRHPCVVDSA